MSKNVNNYVSRDPPINTSLKKVHGQSVTASQLRPNPHRLVNPIKHIYFRGKYQEHLNTGKIMREVIGVVKQLSISTWFMALSCWHLRWPKLFQILARIQGNHLPDKQVDALSCNERCRMLNLNPVAVAKHTRKQFKHSSLECCSLMPNQLVTLFIFF